MPIEPFLDREFAHEVVDADLERLLHHAVDPDGPGPDLQRLGLAGDVLRRIEFVEVVVVGVDLLVGDRAIELVLLVAFAGIKIDGRVGLVADALGERELRRKAGSRGTGRDRQQRSAIEEKMLGGGAAFGRFPAAAADDVHGLIPPD
jgi:hypothetical protein